MVLFSFPLCIGVWAGGRVVRARDRVAGQLAERSGLLERQREQTAQLAVEVERTRLATDLDSAARVRLRGIIDLADGGERACIADPEHGRELFARIERMGRDSLNEMRSLLGVLRSDERASRSPRPTLAQIDTLLAEARAGGRLVDLEIEGERRLLPGGVELAAYRALQHALVAVRGAAGEPATVQLRYLPGALELEVRGFPTEGGAPKRLLWPRASESPLTAAASAAKIRTRDSACCRRTCRWWRPLADRPALARRPDGRWGCPALAAALAAAGMAQLLGRGDLTSSPASAFIVVAAVAPVAVLRTHPVWAVYAEAP
jgi:hypothetical protein